MLGPAYDLERTVLYWHMGDYRPGVSGFRSTTYASYGRGSDPILPAVLEFREETEDAFLRAVITQLDPSSLQFKLAPTYTLYMSAR